VSGQRREAGGGDLRSMLHALLRHLGAAGFARHVAVGVRGASGDRWSWGVFGSRVECALTGDPSRDADAVLLLGESDARAILEDGVLPEKPELALFCGERSVMKRFLRRHTEGTGQELQPARTG
jgi:hypothetical protein